MAKGRVLLAHGNSDCRKIYGSVLSHEGYDVVVLEDSDVALGTLSTLPFDLLVTDLYLPSLEDECLLRRVRASAMVSDLPVIVITGWTTEPHRRLATEHRADAFLALPIRPRELVTLVDRLLDQPPSPLALTSPPLRAASDRQIPNGF